MTEVTTAEGAPAGSEKRARRSAIAQAAITTAIACGVFAPILYYMVLHWSQVADYSHGMRKKLALAAALLPAPRLLFLDEPFTGLDAVASREIRALLQSFVHNGGTIFLTSHILEIVERLCDHIGVIHRGRMVAQGPIDDVRSGAGEHADLEQVFLELVGAQESEAPTLNWLSR